MQMKPYKQWAPGYEHCDNEQGWGPQSTIAPPCSTHSPPDIIPWDSADACDGKEGAFYLVCKHLSNFGYENKSFIRKNKTKAYFISPLWLTYKPYFEKNPSVS